VNRLAYRLRGTAGRVLDGADDLISDSFACQLIVTRCPADTLLQFTEKAGARSCDALLRSPQRRLICGILYIVVASHILRSGLIEHNVGYESDPDTGENPGNSFHWLHLLLDWMQTGWLCRREIGERLQD
jgi:hypothetical protein